MSVNHITGGPCTENDDIKMGSLFGWIPIILDNCTIFIFNTMPSVAELNVQLLAKCKLKHVQQERQDAELAAKLEHL